MHSWTLKNIFVESRVLPGRKLIGSTLNTPILSVWSHSLQSSQNPQKIHLHFRHIVRVLCSLPLVPPQIYSLTNSPKYTLLKTLYFQHHLKNFGQHMPHIHGCKAVCCKRTKSKMQLLLYWDLCASYMTIQAWVWLLIFCRVHCRNGRRKTYWMWFSLVGR